MIEPNQVNYGHVTYKSPMTIMLLHSIYLDIVQYQPDIYKIFNLCLSSFGFDVDITDTEQVIRHGLETLPYPAFEHIASATYDNSSIQGQKIREIFNEYFDAFISEVSLNEDMKLYDLAA